jgi:hypothetical protein
MKALIIKALQGNPANKPEQASSVAYRILRPRHARDDGACIFIFSRYSKQASRASEHGMIRPTDFLTGTFFNILGVKQNE